MHFSQSLQNSYAVIGRALLCFEANARKTNNSIELAFTELREDLVFINTEVLESFLEDLLNIKIRDLHLCIVSENSVLSNFIYKLILYVLTFALIGTLFMQESNLILVTIVAAIAGLLVTHASFSPFAINRRMFFARAISREIARRRGQDSDQAKIALKDFFTRSTSEASSQALPGAAQISHRYVTH